MTPTLSGRIQTRLFLLATVGLGWTILLVPLLPRFGAPIGDVYGLATLSLLLVGLLGLGSEAVYHGIQQYRWEKDWPMFYGLITGVPEFLVVYGVLTLVSASAPNVVTVFLHFASTWIVVLLMANGPMRVVFIRWRYRGGRIL
jgi:hypothetical protein